MNRVTISKSEFYDVIIAPAFADIIPSGFPFKGLLNEFTLMDDVAGSKKIVNIRKLHNILQRRDASCDINYKKVMGADTRIITTDEVYAATKFCRNEFYQGCLKDFRNGDPIFVDKILPTFIEAILTDVAANAYFGDTSRVHEENDNWRVNAFNGIFYWMKRYITDAAIPAAQTIAIADGTDYAATPSGAYNLLKSMYAKRPVMMGAMAKKDLAFYVSQDVLDAYTEYLNVTATVGGNIVPTMEGFSKVFFNGIEVLVEPLWAPILYELKGGVAYAAVLTVRGNFVFGYDKNYGEGPDGTDALEVWYETKDMQWYYRYFMKAGTNIALPEYIIVALSNFS